MKKLCWIALILSGLLASPAAAGPADYSLRIKAGPSFNLNDADTQGRVGGEFDYDFGYSMGFNLQALFGISDTFRFDLVPSFRYAYLYLGPAYLYGLFGMGLGVWQDDAALDLRMGTGISLPLGDYLEFNSDVNLYVYPAGTPGTPVTLDWLLALGFKFH